VNRQLQELFDRGALIRPSDQQPNLVHLVRSLATLAGVRDLDYSPVTQHLIDLIRPAEHIVFVLLDGLGMNLLRTLPNDSFLVRHFVREIQASCPSTTACALTTITTAMYPNRHGVTGWYTHLPEHDLTMATLPFAERMTAEPLGSRGIKIEEVLPYASICPKMTHQPLTIVPALITNTVYNVYSRGGAPGLGYYSISHAFDRAIGHIQESGGLPTYTHVYLPEIDTMCHRRGVMHPDVFELVMKVDAELARLKQVLAGRARIVMCADHGLIDVPSPEQTLLQEADPLLDLLQVPPSGDARLPIFHVRPGQHEAFVSLFRQRFGNRMILLDIEAVQELALFGPGEFAPTARRRFGDYIGIATRPATLSFHSATKPMGHLYRAVHAGLSPDEMLVPLCIT
jgi:hypothetical protein